MTADPDQEPAAAPAVFELWRQDDNGNRFLVSAHTSRAEADAAIAALEGGVQHKQLYFVRTRDR